MKSFSKLSLYDFLAILIPGFVILWFFDFFKLNIACPIIDILIAILSYLTGLCYHKLMELVVTITNVRRSKNLQEKAWKKFYNGIGVEKDFPNNIDVAFVQSYYKIAKEGCLMNIPVLEAQETFLRNMIPLVFFSIIRLGCCNNCRALCVFLGVLLLWSIVGWLSIMKKIYELVWEGSYYLSQIEKNLREDNIEQINNEINEKTSD